MDWLGVQHQAVRAGVGDDGRQGGHGVTVGTPATRPRVAVTAAEPVGVQLCTVLYQNLP